MPPPPSPPRSSTEEEEEDIVLRSVFNSTFYQRDVVGYLHTNIVQFGVTRVYDLLLWHSTCRAHYADWCREEYIVTLCTLASEASESLYGTIPQGKYFGDAIRWRSMAMAVTLAESLFRILRPDKRFIGNKKKTKLGNFYGSVDNITIDDALVAIGYDYNKTGSGTIVAWLLRRVMAYLPQRYGWDLVFKREDALNTKSDKVEWILITKAHKVEWGDMPYLRLAENTWL